MRDTVTASLEIENSHLRKRLKELEQEVEHLRAYLRDTMVRDALYLEMFEREHGKKTAGGKS